MHAHMHAHTSIPRAVIYITVKRPSEFTRVSSKGPHIAVCSPHPTWHLIQHTHIHTRTIITDTLLPAEHNTKSITTQNLNNPDFIFTQSSNRSISHHREKWSIVENVEHKGLDSRQHQILCVLCTIAVKPERSINTSSKNEIYQRVLF